MLRIVFAALLFGVVAACGSGGSSPPDDTQQGSGGSAGSPDPAGGSGGSPSTGGAGGAAGGGITEPVGGVPDPPVGGMAMTDCPDPADREAMASVPEGNPCMLNETCWNRVGVTGSVCIDVDIEPNDQMSDMPYILYLTGEGNVPFQGDLRDDAQLPAERVYNDKLQILELRENGRLYLTTFLLDDPEHPDTSGREQQVEAEFERN